MPSVTGGEAIVESLVAHGVDTIFALPGVQNDHLFNALYEAQDRVKVIHTRPRAGHQLYGLRLCYGLPIK